MTTSLPIECNNYVEINELSPHINLPKNDTVNTNNVQKPYSLQSPAFLSQDTFNVSLQDVSSVLQHGSTTVSPNITNQQKVLSNTSSAGDHIENMITTEAEYQKGINWDSHNIDTLSNWIVECNKQQFIYDYVLDKTLTTSHNVKIFMLLMSAIQIIISVVNLGVANSQNLYVIWSFKIILATVSTLIYAATQYTVIQKYDEIIKSYTSYTENLGKFLNELTMVSDIKLELRPNGDKFILDNEALFTSICQKCPFMAQSNWKQAMSNYTSYINNLGSGADDYNGRNRRVYDKYVLNTEITCRKRNL